MSKEDTLCFKSNDSSHNFVCSTQMKFFTYSIRWTIKNYVFVSKTVTLLKSPEFPLNEEESQRWYISFAPVEIAPHNEKISEIRINRKNTTKAVKVQSTLSLENDSGSIFHFTDYVGSMPAKYFFWKITGRSLHKVWDWDETSDRSLIINCKVQILDFIHHAFPKISMKPLESNNLAQDMSKFFLNDQTFRDVTISVEGKTFEVHKYILAARSEVFAAMLSSEMSEKMNSLVEIKDLKPEVVEKMLGFIYTDKVDDMDLKELAPELLAAAEKYDLKRLKNICVTAMLKNLSVENVLRILELSDIYSILDLKKAALSFVVSHRQDVKSLDEFKTLIAERPHLLVEFIDIQDQQSFEVKLDFHSNTTS